MKEDLQRRFAELCAEIRNYPTPIARCDEQLAALLEERSILVSRLERFEDGSACTPAAIWINDGGFDAA